MKEIITRQGDRLIVDDDWYWLLSRFSWSSRNARGYTYAYTYKGFAPKYRGVALHRIVASCPDGLTTDHINGNTLDNRLANLRVVSKSENAINQKRRQRNNTSGFTGVYWQGNIGKWLARIKVNGKLIRLGYYDHKEEAAKARQEAVEMYFPGVLRCADNQAQT